MSDMALKSRLQSDMKTAMKARDKPRLAVIRLILAAVKQREVDERIELDDQQLLAVLDKMVKQRQESVRQYQSAGRDDLATAEQAEIEIIQAYLPAMLTPDEVTAIIQQTVSDTGAASMRDMGQVMAVIKPQVQGRADMAEISQAVKKQLAG
ncbi:MAG: GatB/YqeY domain-containing protein [Pseudomonadota bacterium]